MATKSKTTKSGGRQPDYDLSFLNKDTGQKGRIGAAWSNPDGSISLTLNPMVTVPSDQNLVLKLFKRGSRSPVDSTEPTPF